MINIFQVHSNDHIARMAISTVLNRAHSGRIRQKVLDFWRRDYVTFINNKNGGNVIFLLAFNKHEIVGISCTAILNNSRRCFNSITVVSNQHTGRGIGASLLSSKLKLIDTRYTGAFLVTYVSKSNIQALKMCEKAGLHIIDEGTREREGKSPTEFYVLSNNKIFTRAK